jgi:hypothetical protein
MVDELEITLAEKTFAPKVRELHVDFLLEEEFCVSLDFLKSFLKAAKRKDVPVEIVEVKHSASDQHGEADLVVTYRVEGGKKVGLLIEDKIRASFQPNQAGRYDLRRDAGIEAKSWDDCWTCLVAPRSYIERGHGFDAALCLEDIKEWLASDDHERHKFKARIVEQAIDKAAKTGAQIIDAAMTTFRRGYFTALNNFFGNERIKVEMNSPGNSYAGEIWFRLKSALFAKGTYIHHKSDRGFVDLTFPDTDAKALNGCLGSLEPGMEIIQTGKSAAIRLEVPKVENFGDFESQRPTLHTAFTEIARLLAFYQYRRDQIDNAVLLTHRPKHKQENGSR